MPYTRENWKERNATRSDVSCYVTHLTKSSIGAGKTRSVTDNLIKILKEKTLIGSTTTSGFICGTRRAVCFQDSPVHSLGENVYFEQQYRKKVPSAKMRYLGAGLMFEKDYVYQKKGRPVIYEKTSIAKEILPRSEWWRIVGFDISDEKNVVDWTHEREWRVPDEFKFSLDSVTVVVPSRHIYKTFVEECRKIEDDIDILAKISGIITLGAAFY